MINKQYFKEMDLLFLAIYFFSLPIAHFTAVQSISITIFILLFLIKFYKNINLKPILYFKNIIYVFFVILLLAIISLYNTPDLVRSIKEIKSEILRNFILLFIFFYYTTLIDEKKIKKIIFIIFIVLSIHSIINIFIWCQHGLWPYRAGGLLDSGGGERFGIWATYMLSASIALFATKYKKLSLFLLLISVVSIVANQTRATFVAAIMILTIALSLYIKNKKIKIIFFIFLLVLGGLFIQYSQHFSKRYNAKQLVTKFDEIIQLPPNNFNNINMDISMLQRLSMWKSALLYRVNDPFVPQEYGRFLFGKSIKHNFKNQPQNLPMKIYAQTHNDFIGIFYSLGIFGLFAFLYFLYYELKISYALIKESKKNYYKIISMFIFFGTVGYIGSMMFGSFFGDSEAKFFYPLYGVMLGIFYNEKTNNYKS